MPSGNTEGALPDTGMPPGMLAAPGMPGCLQEPAGLVEIELAVAHAGDERAPFIRGVPMDWAFAVVSWCRVPGSSRHGRPLRRSSPRRCR